MPSPNIIHIAAAGSRKTTLLVEEALASSNKQILVTTYTNENLEQIRRRFCELNGCIPPHVVLQSWVTFLLSQGARPFQNMLLGHRITSVDFDSTPSWYLKKNNADTYYLNKANEIYNNHLSEFVCDVNATTKGFVVSRLEEIYDHVYIDELQDLNGYDLDFLQQLFESKISVTAVGDPRQWVYSTNNGKKNSQYKGTNITKWISKMEGTSLCTVIYRNECFRSNQTICDFADSLYPTLQSTISKYTDTSDHDGVFVISPGCIDAYYKKYKPMVLRYDRRADTYGYPAANFGEVKGMTYDRVMICTNKPIIAFLEGGGVSNLADVTRSKLYVAITRARMSVAFVYGGKKQAIAPLHLPESVDLA